MPRSTSTAYAIASGGPIIHAIVTASPRNLAYLQSDHGAPTNPVQRADRSYHRIVLHPQARQPFWHRHPFVTAGTLLVAAWMLQNGWYTAVALPAALVVYFSVRRARRTAEYQRAGLRDRADIEHRMILAGDPRGIHGRYPPVQLDWSQGRRSYTVGQ